MSAPARKSKSFGTGARPVGKPSMDLNIYDQTFRVRGAMSGVRIMEVMRILDGEADESTEEPLTKLHGFLADVFLTEDRERGMAFLRDADPPIEFLMLVEILQWLIEQYTGHPTQQPEPSEDTSTTNGSSSSESASSPDPTPATLTDTSSGPQGPRMQPVGL